MVKLLMSVFLFIANVAAAPMDNDKICKEMHSKVEDECVQSMCDDEMLYQIEADIIDDASKFTCTMDGDFWEGVSVCMDEFYVQVEEYNKKNPNTQLNCDDVDFE